MKRAGTIKGLAVCLAVLGFCIPQPLLAATQADRPPAVTDVTLHDGPQGNALTGQVLDQQGAALPNVPVALYGDGQKLAEANTDRDGNFAFNKLRGGVYQMTAAGGVGVYRVWTPGTAPPSAQPGALVVAGTDLARGQCHPLRHTKGRLMFWLCHPCVIAGVVAAAVAIPVAIHNAGPKSPCGCGH
jgi:hypothetical protein